MVEVGAVIGVVMLVGLLIVGVTWLAARSFRIRDDAMDERMAAVETVSGRCEACEGLGYSWRAGQRSGRPAACWRCGGTGLPPTE